MNSLESRFQLKRPMLVYLLAACFILAPVGNIFASMIAFGVYHWYEPATLVAFVRNISWMDWAWLLLTMVAGLALLNQRKSSWLLAIAALFLASGINFYSGMRFSTHLSTQGHFFPILFTISNLGVIVVLYHFRYPYLDRRDAWWGVYPRFRCHIPVSSQGFSGVIVNISRSGAFIQPSAKGMELGKKAVIQFAGVSDLEVEVVHVSRGGFGIQFAPTRSQRIIIRRVVRELSAAPIGEPAPI